MKKQLLFSLAISTFLLSGCGTDTGFEMPKLSWPDFGGKNSKDGSAAQVNNSACPQTGIMPDLGSITDMRGSETVYTTNFGHLNATCQALGNIATVRLQIPFNGELGPAGIKDAKVEANYSIPYFVAVVDPNGNILSKDIFSISMIYSKGQLTQTTTDLLEQTIPMTSIEAAPQYKIMVGFQLTDEQLAYNRSHGIR